MTPEQRYGINPEKMAAIPKDRLSLLMSNIEALKESHYTIAMDNRRLMGLLVEVYETFRCFERSGCTDDCVRCDADKCHIIKNVKHAIGVEP